MLSEITRRPDRGVGVFLSCMLVLGVLIAASGSVSLPMDGHEVFVVQTTQEMHDRNDWVVPWFNGEPRLNKPPLNYWLTGAIAWMTGSLDQVEAWHGRFVSSLGAMAMVILVFIAGNLLYGRRVAVLAASFLVTSLGFFNYSHDARPDMLYAMLCSAGYVAFIHAWKTNSNRARISSVYLMWATYALATLSKGPQMPAMFLVASVLFCRPAGIPLRESLKLFRPFTGLILYIALTLPWWYLVQHQLGGQSLHGTQLSGSLLTVRFDQFYNLYYFYRPLLLVLPWLIFLPHTILRLKRERLRGDGDKLLILYILVPALMLSFGSQQRWIYMLPSLPPMILLLATGADYFLEQRRDPQQTYSRLLFLCLAGGVAFIIAGHRQTGWSSERFEFYNLAQRALPLVREGMPVYTMRVNPDVYVYYLHTRIREENSLDTILSKIQDTDRGPALVILNTAAVPDIPRQIPHELLYTTQGNQNKTLTLVKINLLR